MTRNEILLAMSEHHVGSSVEAQRAITAIFEAGLIICKVEEIYGLEDALKNVNYDKPDVTDYLTVGEYFIADESYRNAHAKVVEAAKKYQKIMEKQMNGDFQ